jgi:hypothetical protein
MLILSLVRINLWLIRIAQTRLCQLANCEDFFVHLG